MAAPQNGKRNILITSALPYVNNIPHLGNIIGSVLSADVFVGEKLRTRGRSGQADQDSHDTAKLEGIPLSDEYGTATEVKALEEGVTPQELCTKYNKIHADIYQWFNIGFDKFGRTSTREQTEITQDIFRNLDKNGYLEENTTVQPYCETHHAFLADRFVEGECSICHDSGARGDQCDKCGNLLDPFEPESEHAASSNDEPQAHGDQRATGWLINPRCKIDGATPVRRKTKHIYIRLDALKDKIVEWFEKASKEGSWSANTIQITQSWIDRGLKPRAITRDLKWGTPVPRAGYEDKVFYVWFDACIGYVSITATHTPEWKKWWKATDEVKLYQFMAKDNVPFHSILFPGSQLGTGEKWTIVHHLSTTEYLNYEGGKFSKSKNIGVFGTNARDTGIAPDIWRYYLLSRRPESSDSEFKWSEFIDANNNDLLKNFGNFVNRVVKFVVAKYDSTIPDYTKYKDDYLDQHKKNVDELLQRYIGHLEAVKLRAGLTDAMHISALGNKLLQDRRLDNRLFSDSPEHCAAVVGIALNHILLLANAMAPYMPDTYTAICAQLGVDAAPALGDAWDPTVLKPGHKIGTPAYLFSQIKPEKEQEWREAFGGEEARKQKELLAARAAEKKAAKEREKARRAAKKVETAAGAGASGTAGSAALSTGVEAEEKRNIADPAVEKVTEALGNADVHTS